MSVAVPGARRRRMPLPRSVTADWSGRVGLLLLTIIVLLALLGPAFAPHSTTAPIGIPGDRPEQLGAART